MPRTCPAHSQGRGSDLPELGWGVHIWGRDQACSAWALGWICLKPLLPADLRSCLALHLHQIRFKLHLALKCFPLGWTTSVYYWSPRTPTHPDGLSLFCNLPLSPRGQRTVCLSTGQGGKGTCQTVSSAYIQQAEKRGRVQVPFI